MEFLKPKTKTLTVILASPFSGRYDFRAVFKALHFGIAYLNEVSVGKTPKVGHFNLGDLWA